MMFWTVALGLGGWSLAVVSDGLPDMAGPEVPATAIEPKPGVLEAPAAVSERITVQVEESQEPEDVNDSVGADIPALWPIRE
jgi:hypothetical protein